MIIVVDGWELLQDNKSNELWDKVYKKFKFNPDYNTKDDAFVLNVPYDLYDCTSALIKAETDIQWANTIQKIFMQVIGDDEYMYALDWQHDSFKYNPSFDKGNVNTSYLVKNGADEYNVYLPKFYPDGEYFLFIAQDFRWGYLTDPWRNRIFVYGDDLRNEINKNRNFLELLLIK